MMGQLNEKNSCGPCLSEKEMKKMAEQEAKDLKATISYLAKNHGLDKEVAMVTGALVTKLIRLQGPLK